MTGLNPSTPQKKPVRTNLSTLNGLGLNSGLRWVPRTERLRTCSTQCCINEHHYYNRLTSKGSAASHLGDFILHANSPSTLFSQSTNLRREQSLLSLFDLPKLTNSLMMTNTLEAVFCSSRTKSKNIGVVSHCYLPTCSWPLFTSQMVSDVAHCCFILSTPYIQVRIQRLF
jgi:hypothetical protein